ncbi:MAG TPA: hypothetical protein VIK27_03805, partial [Candidatus Aquilonibacter sp.]
SLRRWSFSSVRRFVMLGAAAASLCGAGFPAARGAAPSVLALSTPRRLVAIMLPALAQGSANFASLHGGVSSTDDSDIYYKLAPAFKKICPGCTIADEFASANAGERYTVSGNWPVPLTWTLAQKDAYISKYLAPLVSGYKLSHGKNDDGEHWFDWLSATHMFVYVETYHSKTTNGFSIRVGHYIPTSVHFEKWVKLSTDQRDGLSKAVASFVQLGVQNGADNFTALRGKATGKDNNYFDPSVSFGDILNSCDIDGIFATSDETHPRWFFECETRDLGAPKSEMLELIRQAVAGALPYGFTVTTDPQYLGTNDYRWDRSSDSVAVWIWTYDNDDGTTDYHIQIAHFLS